MSFFSGYTYIIKREKFYFSQIVLKYYLLIGVPKGSISTFTDGPFFTHRKIQILEHRVVFKKGGGGGKGEAALLLPTPPILRGSPHQDFQKGN